LTFIGSWAFSACIGLTSVRFPSGLTSIGDGAFYQCSELTSIIFPSDLTSIGDRAFQYCSGLSEVTNLNPVPIAINADVFEGVNKSACVLTVLPASRSSYQSAAVWQDFFITSKDYEVSLTANNALYGSTSGGGLYDNNEQATLTATANTGYAFENWTSNGVILSTSNPFLFTVTSDTIIIANFKSTIGISETKTLSDIVLYPNPVEEVLYIQSFSAIEQATIYDMRGRMLRQVQMTNDIPVQDLARGIYMIKIQTNKGIEIRKIVKE
jgi:hypothetical protein